MPHFDFKCEGCGCVEDRFIAYDERLTQTCSRCQTTLTWVFTPTRQRPVVYGTTSTQPAAFTGPRQRARLIKEKGRIELGDAKPDEVRREFERWEGERDAKHEAEIHQIASEIASEAGLGAV